MIEAVTPEDIAVLLAGGSMLVVGVLGIAGLLTVPTLLFVLISAALLFLSFYTGIEYGQPKRA